jgi:quercetin dioxygenase-like cupin family protein
MLSLVLTGRQEQWSNRIGEHLKEHLSKVPALLVCVSGNAIYNEDNGTTVELKAGDFVHIKLMFNTASMLWPKAIFID